jgi:hypothetical protein
MPDISRYRELAKGNKRAFDQMVMPPYNHMVSLINKFYQKTEEEEGLRIFREYLGDKGIEILKEALKILPLLNVEINQYLRLVEIEEDLIELVKNTDNKIFHRPLFFPTIFINNNIEYDDAIIKGILISEAITREDGSSRILYSDFYKEYAKDANDYIITFFVIDHGNLLLQSINLISDEKIKSGLSDTEIRLININNFVRNMIVNIVDMVEGMDKDLSVTVIGTTKEQNIKRIKRKQIPFPTKVYIRAQGEFKNYVKKFNNDVQENEEDTKRHKISHKFMVRGHWRHFRSERFVHKMGEKIWIKPFWKGEGIPIAKEYKLVH